MGKQGNLNHALWQVLLNMRTYLSHISARDFQQTIRQHRHWTERSSQVRRYFFGTWKRFGGA